MIELNKSVIAVKPKILRSVEVTLVYSDNTEETTVLSEGDIVQLHYTNNTTLVSAKGMVKEILIDSTTRSMSNNDINYTIKLDCSENYKSDLKSIPVSSIRFINKIDINEPTEDEVGDSNDNIR